MTGSSLLPPGKRTAFKALGALVLFGVLFAYLPALRAFFVKDDLTILPLASGGLSSVLSHSFPGGFFRPAAELFFSLEYSVFGLQPMPYHLVSLTGHLTAAYLVFRIARGLLNDEAKGLVVAAVFLLHPLHTESVSWISGQMSLGAGLLGLLAITILLEQRWTHLTWVVVLAAAFILGLGFYENLLVVPVLWLSLCWLQGKKNQASRGPLLVLSLMFVGVSAGYLYWRLVVLGLRAGNYEMSLTPATGLTNLVYYLYLLSGGSAIGGRIIRYRAPEVFSFPNLLDVFTPLFVVQAAIFASALGLAIVSRHRESQAHGESGFPWRRVLLPGVWVLIALLPALLLTERPRRIAYLAVPGYAMVVGQVLFYLRQKTRLGANHARVGLAGYIVLLATTLFFRNQDWRAAGEIEKGLPETVAAAGYTRLAFDVPDLLGDALFFSSISSSFWLEHQTGRKGWVLYSPSEISQTEDLPEGVGFFQYTQERIEQVHPERSGPFPVFVRGGNWVRR